MVQTLLSSLKPISNIVVICCACFLIFGILGVQLFKGIFFYCDGPDVASQNITTKLQCLQVWQYGRQQMKWGQYYELKIFYHLSVSGESLGQSKI